MLLALLSKTCNLSGLSLQLDKRKHSRHLQLLQQLQSPCGGLQLVEPKRIIFKYQKRELRNVEDALDMRRLINARAD